MRHAAQSHHPPPTGADFLALYTSSPDTDGFTLKPGVSC